MWFTITVLKWWHSVTKALYINHYYSARCTKAKATPFFPFHPQQGMQIILITDIVIITRFPCNVRVTPSKHQSITAPAVQQYHNLWIDHDDHSIIISAYRLGKVHACIGPTCMFSSRQETNRQVNYAPVHTNKHISATYLGERIIQLR